MNQIKLNLNKHVHVVFSLNVFVGFPEFLELTIKGFEHTLASKTHVRDNIFKLSPIHASMIYQIP